MSELYVRERIMLLGVLCIAASLLVVIPANLDLQAGTVPHMINYQGRLLDSNDDPFDGSIRMVFAIYTGPAIEEELWSEEHPVVDVDSGVFNAVLGLYTPIPDSVFADSVRFLGITIGMDDELMPRTRLVSVPYAYRVSTIDGSSGGVIVGNIVGTDTGRVLIEPSEGHALHVTDENGDLRFHLLVTTSEASATFYDPVDRSSPNFTGMGKRRVRIDNEGILLFGDNETDTNVILRPDGNVTGRGRLVMGQNSSASNNWSTSLGFSNSATGDSSTITGGYDNTASADLAVISGGALNTASGKGTVIGGGVNNEADTGFAMIGGGNMNLSGGWSSSVCGGAHNEATGDYSVIGGGFANKASGEYSAVLGGNGSAALGDYSTAVGSRAKANHNGSVVVSASVGVLGVDSVSSGGNEQMVLRADGGIYITDASGTAPYTPGRPINTSTGAYLSAAGEWMGNSDRDRKENFEDLDASEILEMVSSLPMSKWNYKVEDDRTKHIGPTAQDFYGIFGIGIDDKSISPRDLAGVALVAIQELHRENAELKTEISELRKMLKRLESHVNNR